MNRAYPRAGERLEVVFGSLRGRRQVQATPIPDESCVMRMFFHFVRGKKPLTLTTAGGYKQREKPHCKLNNCPYYSDSLV